ncbi:MucBP domain-containing protein [Enterococcus cecorum]|uniref:MucBP domain-containing protein n=1 Tax=Enterococcus cecorum TaxID=44008 RepID=UPI001FADE4D8|nr:MucBP domain-containing protein [Enterococcus cecorum]MCJ0549400.1 MucBP domain-containing protein [Enterococcus cecorum]
MIKIGHLKISILNMGDEEVRNQIDRQLKFGLKKKKGGGGAASFIIGSVLLGAMIATPVIVNNQNAVVFAAESSSTTSGTDTYNYQTNPLLINKKWTLVDRISLNDNISDLLINGDNTTEAYKLATTTIGDDNNKVDATVTMTPLKDAYEGISVLQEGKNQASYAATSDMFIGNPNPSEMPALGILTQPAPDEGGNDWSSKFNFDGDFPIAILKISFDKVVTNPVIDVSGIGGSSSTQFLYQKKIVYARGSFSSTVLELLDSDVSLKTASGVNLADSTKEIRVKERNTYTRAVLNDGEKDIEYTTDGYNTNSPKLVPAGTGSIQVLGDVKEISFKVYHSATPYSAFPTETYGTSENYFISNESDPLMADGTNGLNKHWREEYRHANDPNTDYTSSNDDLFRLSLRLPSASVTVHYVDENGNQIKDDEIDTPTSVTGTSYDTTDNKHKEIQGKDGKYYTLLPEEKAVKEGSAAETGTLKDKNLEVTYVYQLNGAVKERHVIKDTETELFNEDGTETARTLAEPGSKIGTAYQGEQKSTTLYDADGNMYKPTDDKDGREDNATGSVKVEEQTVTFEYEPIQGDLVVHYVDEEGHPISGVDSLQDSTQTLNKKGNPYNTNTDHYRPKTVTASDGTVYELIAETPYKGEDQGNLKEGTTEVTYQYRKVIKGGEVKERHVIQGTETELVDEKGQATSAVVKSAGSEIGEAYSTQPKDSYLYDAQGNAYKAIGDNDGREDNAQGKVTDKAQTVTFEYAPVKGNVVVTYEDEEGNPIPGVDAKDVVRDGNVTKEGNPYDTTTETYRPQTVTATDGTVYELVKETPKDGSAPAEGTVKEGTQEVTYVYKKVPAHKVTVTYVDTEGKEIKAPVVDEASLQEGKAYDTAVDNKPQTIEFEGKKYEFVKHEENSASETGTMADKDLTVTYVYRLVEEVKGGEVKERHVIQGTETELVDENGQATSAVVKAAGSEIGEAYNTQPKEGYLYDAQGNAYKAIGDNDGREDNAQGKVTDKAQTVTFEYAPVKGNVVVHYVDENGNTIPGINSQDVKEGNVTKSGTPYDTTTQQFRPQTVVARDGTKYELVSTTPKAGSASATGSLVEGTQEVTYVYRKVVNPPIEVKGGQVVEHHVIQGTETELVDANGQATSAVVKIAGSEIGEAYSTQPKSGYLYDAQGNAYKAIGDNDGRENNAQGKVTELNQTVTFEYTPVKGNVVVHYVDENGNTIPGVNSQDVKEGNVTKSGTPYDTTTQQFRPQAVVATDGTKYELVSTTPKAGSASATGNLVEGTQEVTYVYRKVVAPTPEVKGGEVKERHVIQGTETELVDANGQATTAIVKETGSTIGEAYNTQPKSGYLYDAQGNAYKAIGDNDGRENNAQGKVTQDEQTVTFEYAPVKGNVVVEYVDEAGNPIPGVPAKDVISGNVRKDGNPYDTRTAQFRPEIIISSDGTRYELVSTTPKAGSASAKGNIKEGTQTVTYVYRKVAIHTVTINYVDTDGNTIKQSVVDETALVNGEAYDTTDEGDKPKEIKVNGKVYELVRVAENSAPEKGKMGDKDLSVTYVYKLKQKETTVNSSNSAPASKKQLPKAGSNQTNPVVGVMSLAMASLLAIVAKFKKEETK